MIRCVACGGTVRPLAKAGRTARYKTMPKLPIPQHVSIPTCKGCGTEYLDKAATDALDRALDGVYRTELQRRACAALDRITAVVPQTHLEKLLGLSHGYLSKIRSRDRDPSPELVSELALLARAPARRIRELEKYWEEDADRGAA